MSAPNVLPAPPPAAVAPQAPNGENKRRNIGFVHTDETSINLVRYVRHVLDMQKAGVTFNSDSLCCSSRASQRGAAAARAAARRLARRDAD